MEGMVKMVIFVSSLLFGGFSTSSKKSGKLTIKIYFKE
jgi:hypothetical protein